MTLPDNLRRIIDNLPFGGSVEGLLGYLQTRVKHAHEIYLVARHVDDSDLESALLGHSKALRVYLGISKDRWYATNSKQPVIKSENAAEALAWAATRTLEKYQLRALTKMETEMQRANIAVRSQAFVTLNQGFDQLSEASRMHVVDKLMKPTMLHGIPDSVLLPLQQRLNALRQVVPSASGQRIDQTTLRLTRTLLQNFAANLPHTLPEPCTFHIDRTGPHLLRNIASSIAHADTPEQQIAAVDRLTPRRLAALPPADRQAIRSTLYATKSLPPGNLSASVAMPLEVEDRIYELLQLMAEQDMFLVPLRLWEEQPTLPASFKSKQTAAARIIDCWQSRSPTLNLSSLGLSTLPPALPPHIKIFNVNDNTLDS